MTGEGELACTDSVCLGLYIISVLLFFKKDECDFRTFEGSLMRVSLCGARCEIGSPKIHLSGYSFWEERVLVDPLRAWSCFYELKISVCVCTCACVCVRVRACECDCLSVCSTRKKIVIMCAVVGTSELHKRERELL